MNARQENQGAHQATHAHLCTSCLTSPDFKLYVLSRAWALSNPIRTKSMSLNSRVDETPGLVIQEQEVFACVRRTTCSPPVDVHHLEESFSSNIPVQPPVYVFTAHTCEYVWYTTQSQPLAYYGSPLRVDKQQHEGE